MTRQIKEQVLSRPPRVPGAAWAIGAASLLSDTGHEMVTSVLPVLVTVTLGSSAAVLGAIDGVSDAVMGVSKVMAGPQADHPSRRGPLAASGYAVTATATATIAIAAAAWQVGGLRAVAWAARGVRSPARDAMLGAAAETVTGTSRYGRVFGLERAGDNLGAVLGPLAAAVLVAWIGVRPTVAVSVVPSLLAVAAIITAARLVPAGRVVVRRARTRMVLRHPPFLRAVVPIALFECGNLATTLLILRGMQVFAAAGVAGAAVAAVVLYAGHNAVAAGTALLAGAWSGRVSPRAVLGAAAGAYVIAYTLLAVPRPGITGLVAAFVLAGCGIGLAETAESVLVARALPDTLRGSGYGLIGGVQAGGDIVATLVAGVLYAIAGPTVAFGYAAAWMLVAVVGTATTAHHKEGAA